MGRVGIGISVGHEVGVPKAGGVKLGAITEESISVECGMGDDVGISPVGVWHPVNTIVNTAMKMNLAIIFSLERLA